MATVVTLHLRVENRYLDGKVIETSPVVSVPAPPDRRDETAWDEWAYAYVYPATGTGRTQGDAFYDVTIVRSTDPALIGATFEWGY